MPVPWQHPWYQPWQNLGCAVERKLQAGWPLWQALNAAASAPVRFVPQQELPAGIAYEQFIARTGTCPTRDNHHDFFNGLAWLLFPQTKQALNRLHVQHLLSQDSPSVRGATRDAATLFDENAAWVQLPDSVWRALQTCRWDAAFLELRALWRPAPPLLFGHALLDKLRQPRAAITAHAFRLPIEAGSPAGIDAAASRMLGADDPSGWPRATLHVLGVPGWWPANEHPGFYADLRVFRPARASAAVALPNNRSPRVHTTSPS